MRSAAQQCMRHREHSCDSAANRAHSRTRAHVWLQHVTKGARRRLLLVGAALQRTSASRSIRQRPTATANGWRASGTRLPLLLPARTGDRQTAQVMRSAGVRRAAGGVCGGVLVGVTVSPPRRSAGEDARGSSSGGGRASGDLPASMLLSCARPRGSRNTSRCAVLNTLPLPKHCRSETPKTRTQRLTTRNAWHIYVWCVTRGQRARPRSAALTGVHCQRRRLQTQG
jgi:hypothetical protein